MIACLDVSYEATVRGGQPSRILDRITFEVAEGETVLVSGKSGAGKSTLLSMLAGVRRPTSGSVVADGKPISRYTAAHRDRFRRDVGFVPQRLHLFDELSVAENVALPLVPRAPNRGGAARMESLFRELDLVAVAHLPAGSLSGGERQRVAIARALVAEPRFLILDEPTAHQDTGHVRGVLDMVDAAGKRGAVVVVAAHDPRVECDQTISRVVRLVSGRLDEVGAKTPRPEDRAGISPKEALQ